MHAAWAFALLLAGSGADKPSTAPRVRAAPTAGRAIEDAAARSATVRALLDRLAASDVIVYVEITSMPDVPVARTKLVTATPVARFLRIGINSATSVLDRPALLAHELQHALEIAEHREVRDDGGVRRLYAAIGTQHGVDQFETDAAVRVERQVRAELRR